MRRKPQFDRFMSGLNLRINSIMLSDDFTNQDIVNVTRSECSRVWKYLIEKINNLEKERDEYKKQLEELKALQSIT